MTSYKTGQRVKVEFEGTIGPASASGEAGVYILAERDGTYAHWIWADYAEITVLDPPGWPPQAGDIWATERDGQVREWFARNSNSGGIAMWPDAGTWASADDLKALNPVLARRREVASWD